MFGFLNTSQVKNVPEEVERMLRLEEGLRSADFAELRIVKSTGQYAGRNVTFIRVFDPGRALSRGVTVRNAKDLDGHADLVLRAGIVEQDGRVVILPSDTIGH